MKVSISGARLAFGDGLYEARQHQGKGDFRHTCAFILSPGSEAEKSVKETVVKVAKEQWPDDYKAVLKSVKNNTNKSCVYDGDIKPNIQGYDGNTIISAVRKQKDGRPEVRDAENNPVQQGDEGAPYSGCYVGAVLDIWAQDNTHGKGIRCKLLGVVFQKDGDAFSGGEVATEDDFADLTDGADAPDISTDDDEDSLV